MLLQKQFHCPVTRGRILHIHLRQPRGTAQPVQQNKQTNRHSERTDDGKAKIYVPERDN